MILTDEMLSAAFKYRDSNLWKCLSDNNIFAFRLSDGEVGYCCVMGNGGEHLALGFYRGATGFSTYLKTTMMGSGDMSEMDAFEMSLSFNCINCDFMQASAMNAEVKVIIRNYANAHNLKIRRPNGWPDFTRHQPGKMPDGITDEKDASDIVEALHAALAVSAKVNPDNLVELGFDVEGNYPTLEGGKAVPYLVPNADGTSYDWQTIQLPALQPDAVSETPFSNDILVRQVKRLSSKGVLQMKLMHMPTPIGGDGGEPYLPVMLFCVEVVNTWVFPILTNDGKEEGAEMLSMLANLLYKKGARPKVIEVNDIKTEMLLKDFCARCGITLSRVDELPSLREAYNFVLSGMMGI